MVRTPHRLLASLLVLCLLAGCGWHLRGAPAFNTLDTLALSGASPRLEQELVRELEAAEVKITNAADYRLQVLDEGWERRTIAVDSQGRAAEISLLLNLVWRLEQADGTAVTAQREMNINRTFHYSRGNATAASDEEALLRRSIYRDAVWQIMRQLEATASQLPNATEVDGEPEA